MTTYTYRHVPGHSAYDHYAPGIIDRAAAEGRRTKRGMEGALRRAARAARCPGIAPRIDVVRA